MRFCVDFRRMNKVTRKDAYPLPRIDDTLETLSQPQLFSTLDLASGTCRRVSRENSFQYYGRTLRIQSDAAVWAVQRPGEFSTTYGPDLVLSGLQWSNCLVYIDDIIVMGKTFQEHLKKTWNRFLLAFGRQV